MLVDQEDVFYYITALNENYVHPPMPEGAEDGIVSGMYLFKDADPKVKGPKVQLLGSGAILREVIAGAELLEKDFGVSADIWSVTSFTELRREGLGVERWNMLHPSEPAKVPFVTQNLSCMWGCAGHRVHRLHQAICRSNPALCSRELQGPRHGRFWAFRLPTEAATAFRSRSPLRCVGCVNGAR